MIIAGPLAESRALGWVECSGKSESRNKENPNLKFGKIRMQQVLSQNGEARTKCPTAWRACGACATSCARTPRSRMRAPEFMAVITSNSEHARMVEDGIYAIPIRLLEKQKAHVDNESTCAF